MAKITTKKPGGTSPTAPNPQVSNELESNAPVHDEFDTPVYVEGAPRKAPPIETQPVPSKAEGSQLTPVKVTKVALPKAEQFQAPPKVKAPVIPPEPKRSDPRLGVLILGGALLIVISISKLNTGSKDYDSDYLPLDPTAREMLTSDDKSKLAMSSWRNEEPGFFGRFFKKLCLGYAKSDGCSSKPLHPFTKVADELGIPLSFEKEKDTKVIEQTIEYNSKAFTLNQK